MTKLLFENLMYTEYDKVWILYYYSSEDRESYDYILNTLTKITNSSVFFDFLTTSGEYCDEIIIVENFSALWNKFNKVLTSKQIVDMYEGFTESLEYVENVEEILEIISLISHHPIIAGEITEVGGTGGTGGTEGTGEK
jgi:hypothetical protein